MLRGLYNSASALNILNRQHEQISNNLANLNTAGFRRADYSVIQRAETRRRPTHFGFGPEIEKQNLDFGQGRLLDTGRKLDVAINGDAFFAFQDDTGAVVYSRDGRFIRNPATGEIFNGSNLKLLGQDGPINIPADATNSTISIAADGTLSADGQELGKIKLVSFKDNTSLIPIGQSTFRKSAASVETEPEAQLQQFYHEMSNVNATTELIALIVGGRHYEAIQKVSRTVSESLQESIRT